MPTRDSAHQRHVEERRLGAWMRANLTTQGYRLSDEERRGLDLGLRFSTGTCLALVITALALESSAMVFALSGIGLIAGVSSRHPFDLVWNYGVRNLTGDPPLPPNPTRRRHAFKIATVWLLAVGMLLATGATGVALALGGLLVAACATVTTTNFCIPSELLALGERRRGRTDVRLTPDPRSRQPAIPAKPEPRRSR
jgi:phage-related minor tail protein